MKTVVITEKEAGGRLDKYLNRLLLSAPKGFIYKMLRKKNIVLNSAKACGDEILKTGDEIKLFLSDDTFDKFKGENRLSSLKSEIEKDSSHPSPALEKSMIVYEDEDIILVNKPAGILSQRAGRDDVSINEMCLKYLLDKGELKEEELISFKPSIINRLDMNTSGIIIFAKSLNASRQLSEALKARTIAKYYKCAVAGIVKSPLSDRAYLTKDNRTNIVKVYKDNPNGDYSLIETAYSPIKYGDDITMLEVDLLTGRSHQIRAHLSYLGHPIIGDVKYGDGKVNNKYRTTHKVNHQTLISYKVVFPNNLKGSLEKLNGKTYEIATPEIDKLFTR